MRRKSIVPTVQAAAFLLACTFGAGATPSMQGRGEAKGRPNILIVIADDVGLDVTTGMYPGMIDGRRRPERRSTRKC
jgi:hypothetical protein